MKLILLKTKYFIFIYFTNRKSLRNVLYISRAFHYFLSFFGPHFIFIELNLFLFSLSRRSPWAVLVSDASLDTLFIFLIHRYIHLSQTNVRVTFLQSERSQPNDRRRRMCDNYVCKYECIQNHSSTFLSSFAMPLCFIMFRSTVGL